MSVSSITDVLSSSDSDTSLPLTCQYPHHISQEVVKVFILAKIKWFSILIKKKIYNYTIKSTNWQKNIQKDLESAKLTGEDIKAETPLERK